MLRLAGDWLKERGGLVKSLGMHSYLFMPPHGFHVQIGGEYETSGRNEHRDVSKLFLCKTPVGHIGFNWFQPVLSYK